MKKVVLSAILFVGAGLIASFGQQIGQVVYVQGSVQLSRGDQSSGSGVAIGDEIDDLDTVQTGDDGQLTISTNESSGVSSTIDVGPDTTFTFNFSDESNPQQHTIDLMDGTLAMTVQALAANEVMNVDTGNATMGIRGTKLDVSAIPSGDVLLTVDEGKVACTTEEGTTLYAQPGVVVQDVNDSWDNQPVPVATLSTFRRTWRANRAAYLSAHADQILERLSASYLQERSRFSEVYDRLMENRATIDRWLGAERAGTLSRQEFEQIRAGVGASLVRAHRSLIRYAHLYYRLRRLEALSRSGTLHFTSAQGGMSAEQFFALFDRNRSDDVAKIREIRTLVRFERRESHARNDRPRAPENAAPPRLYTRPAGR